jgi:hypothetical protein
VSDAAPERIRQTYEAEVALDRLHEHPRNPRKGHMGQLDRSMAAHGFFGVVYAQHGTGVLIAGNHRHRKAVERGEPHIPVLWFHVDDDKAFELLLVDNRAGDLATYDDRLLLEGLAALESLDGTGYDPGDLSDLEHLLDPGAWGDPAPNGGGSGGDGDPGDDGALAPRIDLVVPIEVFEAWTALLRGYEGTSDVAKLSEHLRELGHLR